MAKNFTLDDLERMGLTVNPDGSYSKGGKDVVKLGGVQEVLVAKQPVIDTPDFVVSAPIESYLTIDGIVAGLNGDKGLMRAHWTSIKKQKEFYCMIIKEQLRINKVRQHSGPVTIHYIGYKSSLMDWDNFCSSFKHIGDSLVKMKIITDDKPTVVRKFLPEQIKCKRVDQKVIVIIQDIKP